MEWYADRIDVFVDGQKYFTLPQRGHGLAHLALRQAAVPADQPRDRRLLGRPEGHRRLALPEALPGRLREDLPAELRASPHWSGARARGIEWGSRSRRAECPSTTSWGACPGSATSRSARKAAGSTTRSCRQPGLHRALVAALPPAAAHGGQERAAARRARLGGGARARGAAPALPHRGPRDRAERRARPRAAALQRRRRALAGAAAQGGRRLLPQRAGRRGRLRGGGRGRPRVLVRRAALPGRRLRGDPARASSTAGGSGRGRTASW